VDNPVERVDKPSCDRSLGEGLTLGVAIGVFAKQPVVGQVKTRLCPPLTATQAAQLYEQSLLETMAQLGGLPLELVLFYSGQGEWFRRAFPGIRLIPQGDGDLGKRMARALATLLGEWKTAALVGSDSPDLPPALIGQAVAALAEGELVTIPARDGGYVLIGESRHRPEFFTDIPWSTAQVLTATRQRAAELSVAYREVGVWEDIDDLASLLRLIERSPTSPTARLARQLLGRNASTKPSSTQGAKHDNKT
jgi:uncharacterized protein